MFISRLSNFNPSGYQDSNLGPPAPKAGALTGLRYTPNSGANIRNYLQFATILPREYHFTLETPT